MYKQNKPLKTSIKHNESYVAERLEIRLAKVFSNKEPITDGAVITYTERKDGVKPEYDIRTDKWEIAIDAMDTVSKTYRAKRMENPNIGEQAKEGMKKEEGGTNEGMKKENGGTNQ